MHKFVNGGRHALVDRIIKRIHSRYRHALSLSLVLLYLLPVSVPFSPRPLNASRSHLHPFSNRGLANNFDALPPIGVWKVFTTKGLCVLARCVCHSQTVKLLTYRFTAISFEVRTVFSVFGWVFFRRSSCVLCVCAEWAFRNVFDYFVCLH